jgi:uncharacterized protein YdhG (YjbR/CyaY superfamily)
MQMTARQPKPATIDDYVVASPAEIRPILKAIRQTIRQAAPEAVETISYGMPAFAVGREIVVYFGAFKSHIGLFPPVRGPELVRRTAAYRGEKGNLKFPLGQPIPHDLIAEVVKARLEELRR